MGARGARVSWVFFGSLYKPLYKNFRVGLSRPPVTTQRAGGDGGPWMSYFKCKQIAYTFIYENGLLRNHKFHRHGR